MRKRRSLEWNTNQLWLVRHFRSLYRETETETEKFLQQSNKHRPPEIESVKTSVTIRIKKLHVRQKSRELKNTNHDINKTGSGINFFFSFQKLRCNLIKRIEMKEFHEPRRTLRRLNLRETERKREFFFLIFRCLFDERVGQKIKIYLWFLLSLCQRNDFLEEEAERVKGKKEEFQLW